jgi:hypothetical protein
MICWWIVGGITALILYYVLVRLRGDDLSAG